jgi:carotenoid cleavage dioxygenase-like enzyme
MGYISDMSLFTRRFLHRPDTTYNIYELRDGESTLLGTLPVQKPGYIHSFGMTEHYVILAEIASAHRTAG